MINDEIIKKAGEVFRTPFYLYDKEEIISHANLLKRTIFEGAQLFFSMKANPRREIIECLLEQGCGVEVASANELKMAITVGCDPQNIVFTGPGKGIDELEMAVEAGIFCTNVESILEIERLIEIADKRRKSINIGIRVNLQNRIAGRISMSGVTQFGIIPTQVEEAIKCARKSDYIHVIGFQVYAGTQILDSNAISENVEQTIECVFKIGRAHV